VADDSTNPLHGQPPRGESVKETIVRSIREIRESEAALAHSVPPSGNVRHWPIRPSWGWTSNTFILCYFVLPRSCLPRRFGILREQDFDWKAEWEREAVK